MVKNYKQEEANKGKNTGATGGLQSISYSSEEVKAYFTSHLSSWCFISISISNEKLMIYKIRKEVVENVFLLP